MKYLSIGLVTFFIVSCGVEPSGVGSDFFTGGALDFAFVDSSSVNLSTVQYERVVTNGSSRILVGSYRDERLGMVKASAFIQMSPSGTIDLQNRDITYDYLALILKYDSYAYYDTSQLSLTIHRVSQEIALDDNGALYNSSQFSFYNEPLATVSFTPRPHRDDSVSIKLSDVLGRELFNKAMAADDDIATANFTKYIRGLVIIPDTAASKGIIGFGTTPDLRLYYTDRNETPVQQKYISIPANRYFTRIQSTRTATKVYPVPEDEDLNATETDDEAYLQAGAGLALRVEFPYLRELKQFQNFYTVRAMLEIYPVRKSFSDLTPLPRSLAVFIADKHNDIYQQMEYNAEFVEDLELGRDSRYVLDVTDFVNAQMELPRFREDALLFTSSDFSSSVDRIYAASPSYNYKTQLKIYYATVNNQ